MPEVSVLIVDDEPLICQNVCSKILRLNHGVAYTLHTAQDIFSGFKRFQELRPQIVITDICMPGGNGLSFAEKIRAADKDVTIFVLSGYDDFSYVRQAFLAGVNDYLLKPLSLTELDEKLRLHGRSRVRDVAKAAEAPSHSVLEKAKRYVDENMERPVSLSEICQVTSMSYHYFSKLFKETQGVSFTRYVAERRMGIARELLADPSVRISEIAAKLGFQNPNHFSRAFKSIYGKYPTEFRKKENGDEPHDNN